MNLEKRKVNPEDDLGFGKQPVMKNQPVINKDGSINVKRTGLPFFNTLNSYQTMITMADSYERATHQKELVDECNDRDMALPVSQNVQPGCGAISAYHYPVLACHDRWQ